MPWLHLVFVVTVSARAFAAIVTVKNSTELARALHNDQDAEIVIDPDVLQVNDPLLPVLEAITCTPDSPGRNNAHLDHLCFRERRIHCCWTEPIGPTSLQAGYHLIEMSSFGQVGHL
jgi:hypothetical protein